MHTESTCLQELDGRGPPRLVLVPQIGYQELQVLLQAALPHRVVQQELQQG